MALMINDSCVACTACATECPNEAISMAKMTGLFRINPDLCTECVGFHEESQCVAVCPTGACVPDPGRRETREELLAKKQRNAG